MLIYTSDDNIEISIENFQELISIFKNALNDIKNISIKISIEAVENLIKNSIDKNKLENLYNKSLEQAKIALKQTKA